MKNTIAMTVVAAIVVGAAAFFVGMKYQQGQQTSSSQPTGRGNFAGRQRNGNGGGGGRVVGDIIGQDDKSITVKMPDGSTKIVLLSSTTSIETATSAAKADLKVGSHVGVFGTANSDGSVTAQAVQLNPMMRMFGGGQNDQSSQNTKTQSGQ